MTPKTKIKAVLEAEYLKRHNGKDFLEHKYIRRIHRAAAMIECHPDIRKCFMGGFPEVTVIWTSDGVRRRARLDYLKPAAITDLKSFANKFGKPVNEAITLAFANAKHHIQAEYYTDAARAAVGHAKDSKITVHSGAAPTKEWRRVKAITSSFSYSRKPMGRRPHGTRASNALACAEPRADRSMRQ